jgi:hypothetical protein
MKAEILKLPGVKVQSDTGEDRWISKEEFIEFWKPEKYGPIQQLVVLAIDPDDQNAGDYEG